MTTSTSSYIKGASASFVWFVLSDLLWHNVLMGGFYNAHIEAVSGVPLGMAAPYSVLLFELIAGLGSAYFVLGMSKTIGEGAKNGLILGLMMISTINLVNHFLLPKWDWTLVVVDIGWGMVTGLVAGALIVWAGGTAKG